MPATLTLSQFRALTQPSAATRRQSLRNLVNNNLLFFSISLYPANTKSPRKLVALSKPPQSRTLASLSHGANCGDGSCPYPTVSNPNSVSLVFYASLEAAVAVQTKPRATVRDTVALPRSPLPRMSSPECAGKITEANTAKQVFQSLLGEVTKKGEERGSRSMYPPVQSTKDDGQPRCASPPWPKSRAFGYLT
jgi:hypothetical protein